VAFQIARWVNPISRGGLLVEGSQIRVRIAVVTDGVAILYHAGGNRALPGRQ
jgi:hypothetical protein